MFQNTFFFQDFTIIEIVDILLVLLIVLQLFRSLRGSKAFNIFLGSLIVYLCFLLAKKLQMRFMSEILNRLVSIGLLGLVIVFQPEIRKFLIVLGKRSTIGRNNFITKFFQKNSLNKYIIEEEVIEEITIALRYFQEKKLGATLVILRPDNNEFDTNSGTLIYGNVSAKLLENIFSKNTPLHDGAVLIEKNSIIAAGVVLPISQSTELPTQIGLRHRSAVGATENNDALSIIVSEETSKLSIAFQGKIRMGIPLEDVKKELYDMMTS